MPLGDELLENFNTRALPQSGRVMSPEEEAAEMERMLTEDGEKDDVTAKVVKIVKADIERGKEVNEAESSFRSANYDAYRAKGDGKKERAGHSRIKCSDIMDTIEWMMPSFIKAFAGTTESISISPQNEEDVEKAEKLEKLLNWQFMGRHCKGFTVIYEWVKSCLIYGTSVIKITWQDKYIKKGFDLPIATDDQIYQMQGDDMVKDLDGEPQDIQAGTVIDEDILALANTDPTLLNYIGQVNSQSMQVQPVALDNFRVWRNVHGKKLIKSYSGPLVEVISPEDFYMDPEAKSIEDAQFVIHRVWRTYGYLKEKERDGIYSNVDEVKAWLDRDKESYINSERAQRYNSADAIDPANYAIDSEDKQIARHKLEVFEWWGLLDLTDEGYQEPYLVVFCGETILRMELNPYGHGQPPFEVLRPMLDPFKFTGVSIPELVGEFQAVKTALFRQILDNVSYQNNGAWLVNRNAGVDINALLNMRPNTIVRSNITSGAVVPLTPPNLQGYPLTMIELVDSMLQKRTGVTSYNQGLDANSLNKTATGITKIMDASVQRIELQARVMAETGIKPAFQKILMLNQQFMDQTVVIRVFNKPLEISPDDLIGDFDVSVDVGGATSKNETRVQQMMMLIQSSSLMMSTGVMRPQNIYEICKKIMEIWEWKDYDKYLSDPDETALIQQALQIIQQLGMSMEQGQIPTPDVIVQAFQQIYNLLLQTLAPNAANIGQNPEGVEQNGGQQQNAGGEFPASTVPRSPVDRAFEQAGAYAGGQRPQSAPVGVGQ